MKNESKKICVYFDGACPSCIKDRDNYLRLAGKKAQQVSWVDITHKDDELLAQGIDPKKALKELHIRVEAEGKTPFIVSELEAYIILMNQTRILKPLAWLISLPLIRPMLSKLYHRMVHKRLQASNRL